MIPPHNRSLKTNFSIIEDPTVIQNRLEEQHLINAYQYIPCGQSFSVGSEEPGSQ